MKPEWVDSIRRGLAVQPLPLSRLAEDGRAAGSMWTDEQFRLFFAACEGFSLTDGDDPVVSVSDACATDSLADAIHDIVQSNGVRPVPLAKTRDLLPSAMTTSVEQIRAVALADARLQVTGPVVRLREGA